MRQYTYSNSRSKKSACFASPGLRTTLLSYVLPYLLINGLIFYLVTIKPKYTVSARKTTDYTTTSMSLTIKSILPIRSLSVPLNGEPPELKSTGKKSYTAPIMIDGMIEVYLESFDGIAVSTYKRVDILDDDPPTIEVVPIEDGILTTTLSDSQPGTDFTNLHAINSTGAIVRPLSADRLNYTATFQTDPAGMTLYVTDVPGLTTEQPLSINKVVEGVDGQGESGGDGLSGSEGSSL